MTAASDSPVPPGAAALPGAVPTAVQRVVRVVEQEGMARDTYRLRLECPEIAAQIVPGQFFMVRATARTKGQAASDRRESTVDPRSFPLLGRPFALYDIYEEAGRPAGVDFGYVVVGKLTSLMSGWRPGDRTEVWGPLGNGFPPPPAGAHLMLVAGGIGQTPFLAVAREALGLRRYAGRNGRQSVDSGRWTADSPRTPGTSCESAHSSPSAISAGLPRRVSMCYGVRSAEYFAGLDDFALPGLEMQLTTDDGSRGHYGFVTDLLARSLAGEDPPDVVYACGPESMMRAAAERCAERGVECWLSLETPMACGFGACFSCVARVRQPDGSWDYRRTCVEGPVFRADRLML